MVENGKVCTCIVGNTKKHNILNLHTLTLSDVVKGPLVVLEERVALYLIHSGATQTNLPAHNNRTGV